MDTRFQIAPANKRSNVFSNILQPINFSSRSKIVQAEIHSRKRQDRIKFTILLNNMSLMAVFDWWDAARKFILEDSTDVPTSPKFLKSPASDKNEDTMVQFELKLNITDSEIIVVEDMSQWDTNVVVFKSTTVLSYKSFVLEKSLSCNLNNCEMYSCILGMEDETALSIIDPVTWNMEINKNRILEVRLQSLTNTSIISRYAIIFVNFKLIAKANAYGVKAKCLHKQESPYKNYTGCKIRNPELVYQVPPTSQMYGQFRNGFYSGNKPTISNPWRQKLDQGLSNAQQLAFNQSLFRSIRGNGFMDRPLNQFVALQTYPSILRGRTQIRLRLS